MSLSGNVLVLSDNHSESMFLSNLLSSSGFETTVCKSLGDTFFWLSDNEVDTIICLDKVNDLEANSILLRIKEKNFLKSNTCFFVILPREVEKETLILGAEIGVDRFFFHPINESVLISSIKESQLKKTQFNLLKSKDFIDYVTYANKPICFVYENNIYFSNEPFQSYFPNVAGNGKALTKFDSLFDLGNDRLKKADFDRFKLGLFKTLRLLKVKTKGNEPIDLFFFRGDFLGQKAFIVELERNSKELEASRLIRFNLSKREKEIAVFSSKGFTIKAIADSLSLSPRTVERHRAKIMEKTNSKNIIEALGKLKDEI